MAHLFNKNIFYYSYVIKMLLSEINYIILCTLFLDTQGTDGTFFCDQFQFVYSLESQIAPDGFYDSFVSTIVNSLSQKGVFNDEVKSLFESEEKMIKFIKQLFIKLMNIIDFNSYQVR